MFIHKKAHYVNTSISVLFIDGRRDTGFIFYLVCIIKYEWIFEMIKLRYNINLVFIYGDLFKY
jgi:hypothetical protein